MKDKSRIMARTIASLGCSAQARNLMISAIMGQKNLEFDSSMSNYKERKLYEQSAKQFTVKDFLDAEDAYLRSWIEEWRQGPLLQRLRTPRISKEISRKLVKTGLTQLDLIFLPNATITNQMLRRLGKKELFGRSIFILGTLSSTALVAIEKYFKKHPLEITIRDFINTSEKMWDRYGTLKKSVSKIRQKLREISFSYKDGIFLQEGTKHQLIEDLIAKEGLSRKTATKVVEIAQKRGWVSRAMVQ